MLVTGFRMPLRYLRSTGQVRRAFAPVQILEGIVLLVILVGVGDTLTVSVLERTHELGTIRALGAQRRSVHRMVLTEALLIGLLGAVLADAGGLTLGVLWFETTFTYLLGWILHLRLPLGQVVITTVLGLGVCALAALPAARRAARLEPAEALRYE